MTDMPHFPILGSSPATRVDHVRVGGMDVAVISNAELIDLMLRDSVRRRKRGDRPKLVFDVNAHAISLFATNATYRDDVRRADIVHADGQVVVTASRLLCRRPVPDRSATTDLFIDSLGDAAKLGTRFFLLGGTESVNEKCASLLATFGKGVNVCGRHNGFFRGNEDAVIEAINAAAPDVLWVGLGKPLEQRFCVQYQDRLNVGWIVTCGGLFNYVTGDYPRAPVWMQRSGLEWLHRLSTNPRHLWWRYLTTNPHALWRIWRLRNERRHA